MVESRTKGTDGRLGGWAEGRRTRMLERRLGGCLNERKSTSDRAKGRERERERKKKRKRERERERESDGSRGRQTFVDGGWRWRRRFVEKATQAKATEKRG